MEFYCEESYNSFKDIMNTTYDTVFSDYKDGFTLVDMVSLTLFSSVLNSLCCEFKKELEKEIKKREREEN